MDSGMKCDLDLKGLGLLEILMAESWMTEAVDQE